MQEVCKHGTESLGFKKMHETYWVTETLLAFQNEPCARTFLQVCINYHNTYPWWKHTFDCNKHFVTAKAKSLNKCVKHTHCQCTYRALRRVDSRVHSQSSSSASERPLREPNMELLLVSFSIAILKGTKLFQLLIPYTMYVCNAYPNLINCHSADTYLTWLPKLYKKFSNLVNLNISDYLGMSPATHILRQTDYCKVPLSKVVYFKEQEC